MLWLKACHIIAMVAWFAGLFYLPRLFVYHADASDTPSIMRFKIMERRLYYGITWPAAVLTTGFGLAMLIWLWPYYKTQAWMHAKLTLVALLWVYHLYLGHERAQFAKDANPKSARFFRILNEIPTVFLIVIVLLVVVKPF